MSTLDRSFMKAFHELSRPATGIDTGTGSEAIEPLVEVEEMPLAEISIEEMPAIVLSEEVPDYVVESAPAAPRTTSHAAHPLHAPATAAPAPASAAHAPASAAHGSATRAAPAAPAPSKPLSSFTAAPKIHDCSHALLEVDRLVWPEACHALLERASREWERFHEHLIDNMSRGQKCLALTSLERGDGRTTATLALAKHLAARGQRVVAVDADFENPSLVRDCGISVSTGWDDLVAGELPLGEALIAAAEDHLTLMPWRGGPARLADLAASLRTARIFGALREQYDLVLLDTGPLGAKATFDDLAEFARAVHLDALYVVQNVRETSRDELAAMCARLRRAALPLAGVIENFVVRSEHGSGGPTFDGTTRPRIVGAESGA